MGAGGGVGACGGKAAGLLPATEVCAALLMLCWLCCWPDDSNSESGTRHRSRGEFFSRRMGSSAVSLHLPSTSGDGKQPLSAHRSHEEIRHRRKSHHETPTTETRYHSAPSVIDEVIHRRDWERSTKELYIPLKPENECRSGSSPSLDRAPYAEPESSSVECLKPETKSPKTCKKHHTNIKSSKKCKESNKDDIKDTDATEVSASAPSNFYIGDTHEESSILTLASTSNYDDFIESERQAEEKKRSIYKAKEAKQSFNESIRLKDTPRKSLVPLEEGEVSKYEFYLLEDIDGIDRSGAEHHTIESRLSFARPYPPPSVEAVGYEGGACYLAEVGSVSELRARASVSPHHIVAPAASLRARHASDGDILAPPCRPESGAFSESDLDLDLEGSEERPPDYDELLLCASPKKKETAI
ncbi:hypothetical protein ABMA27_009683 [Loxostege sticticalis]|uniref:Uncharacterized protein n=1 Tax=Loxostege sticticalis TaxID=481309 RepID=A0ABR3H650_LOXSC